MTWNQRPLGGQISVRTNQHAWQFARLLLLVTLFYSSLSLIASTAGASPAIAVGQSFCVSHSGGAPCPEGSQLKPSIEAAIAEAAGNKTTKIYVVSNVLSYQAASTFDFADKPIQLVGVGSDRPILQPGPGVSNTGAAVVSATSTLAQIENVEIRIPSSTAVTGIRTEGGAKISRVTVSGASAQQSVGIEVTNNSPSISNVNVSLDGNNKQSTGIKVIGRATAPLINDSTVANTGTAVAIEGTREFELRRVKLSGGRGLAVTDSTGTIASSLIKASGTAVDAASSDADSQLNVYSSTLVSTGGSLGVLARTTASGAAMPLTVDSSIITGFSGWAARAEGKDAQIKLKYTHFDSGITNISQGVVLFSIGSHSDVTDFGFVNAAAGDYHLAAGSALIDAGNPLTQDFSQADSASDLDGLPRIVARKGGHVRDVGAYEVQNHAPQPVIAIRTAVPSTTAPVEFSAAESTDADGDAMTYEWNFDGQPGVPGRDASKQFAAIGPHSVRLTVTDAMGASSSVIRQFEVQKGYLRVELQSQNVNLSRGGTFRVNISCPVQATTDCTGKLVLQTVVKVDAKRFKKKPSWSSKATNVKAADQSFRIAPGATRSVEVKATQIFQNILGVKKKFQVVGGIVNAQTGNALLTSNRATYTVKAPKVKKSKKKR
jgi:hypothetical protein